MKRISCFLIMIITIIFSTSLALADQPDTIIRNLPSNGEVTLVGTVDKAGSDHEFTLRTNSGIIVVDMPPDKPKLLKIGDSVIVTGIVNKPLFGIFGNDLQARNVELNYHP